MKQILFSLICIMSINMANAQNVNIPDAEFKSRLVNNPAINTNGDGEIQDIEAVAYNGFMDVATVYGPAIMDLTGIEAFTALTGLDCSLNGLSSLNVSANTALDTLDCYFNFLTSLNVSANTALNVLWCNDNQLASLDVSANTALTDLSSSGNPLMSLDVSTNPALTDLICEYNQLTSLNIQNGNNDNLTLDATNNPALTCIQVDNVAYANSYTSVTFFKDATASYSTACTTGINDVSTLPNTVSIYPNPTSDNFTISLNSKLKNAQMEIYNVLGDKVYSTTLNSKKETINNKFSSGIYFVKVNDGEKSYAQKLIVE